MTTITPESLIDALDAVLYSGCDQVALEHKTQDLLDLADTLTPVEADRFYALLERHVARLNDQLDARRRMAEDLLKREETEP